MSRWFILLGMNWLTTVEIDLALLFTFGLVVFGCLQWLTLKKANDQNLFAMRIEHYREFYKLCNDFLIKIEYYKPENIPNKGEIEILGRLTLELEDYIDESKFLFREALNKLEREFVNYAKKIFEKFSTNEVISADEILNLKDSYKTSKNWIEDFLCKNGP